jgi:mono/diheme cytochrome c family protein
VSKSQITNHKSQIAIFGILILVSILISCSVKNTRLQQYYAQGQLLYEKNCSNCHQKNGKGLGLVYPPLAESDYLQKNAQASLCIMKYGTQGEMVVNGKNFNKAMPGVPSLTELEIAEIATYIYNSWGMERGMVEIQEVKAAIDTCKAK